MRRFLRLGAVAIAIGGLVDPAIARRVTVPLTIAIHMPPASSPEAPRAEALRAGIVAALDDGIVVDDGSVPHAIVAIGDADVSESAAAPVFVVPLPPQRPGTSILDISVPASNAPGQVAQVRATIRGLGLTGRRTKLALELRGSVVDAVDHEWMSDDESFDARFSFAPPAAGVHRVRVVATTGGLDERSVADAVVVTRARALRVLAFEPRPSWPVAFVRRSLEGDPLFQMASSSRSSRSAVTMSGGAPRSLESLNFDRFDAILVGALDELRDGDLGELDRFVSERGGTLILLPDRRLPESIRRRFDLPPADEVLLEKAASVQSSVADTRASELLLMTAAGGVDTLASVRHGGADRPAIAVVNRGSGRVVLSGALDAWRYRADESGGFDRLWRGLVADGAMASLQRIDVSLSPAIARPGDHINVSVTLRETEFDRSAGAIRLPPVAASLNGPDGRREMIRLWPGARPGTYEARLVAPPQGPYSVSASAENLSTDVPLMVADDVVHAVRDSSLASSQAAAASGGAVVADAHELGRALAALDTGRAETTTRPMRSPWWILPFTLLLCAEWALRRHAGLK